MFLHTSRTGSANRLISSVVITVVLLILATNVFGGQQVWSALWKAALFVLIVVLFALFFCVWRENKTSTHQRYG